MRIFQITAGWLFFSAAALAHGRPDFSGVWERDPPLHAPAVSAEQLFAEEPGSGTDDPVLREPYASRYEKFEEIKRAAENAGKPLEDSSIRCLPQGMPTLMMAVLPLEILQSRHEIVVLAEELAQTRRIYIGEKMPPLDEIAPGYFGFSTGRWQGDTLVVQTLGIREDVQFLDIPHTAQMKVIEQFRLKQPGRLEVKITIEDPTILAQPYSFTFNYKRNPEYKVGEYVCDHNHYAPDGNGGVSLDTNPKH
jgi:hypothetical protein